MTYRSVLFICLAFLIASCGGSGEKSQPKVIGDLPFAQAKDAKAYADVVLRAIKTNRGKILAEQFASDVPLNKVKFNRLVSMYGSGIGGREWEAFDFHELSKSSDQSKGFDYAWLDQKGRLGLQIYILPKHNGDNFELEKIEFRSRLKVMESVGFPSGEEIDEYKKVDYDWEDHQN